MARVRITISGPSNCGKSTIAHLIKGLLKGFGFNVEVGIDDDYGSLEEKNHTIGTNLSERIKDIRSKHDIKIVEEYKRTPQLDEEISPISIDDLMDLPF